MDAKDIILEHIRENDEELSYIAKDIWDHPQVALQEEYASRLLAEKLEADGFSISWGAGGMPTAFIAEWGEGGAGQSVCSANMTRSPACRKSSPAKRPRSKPAVPVTAAATISLAQPVWARSWR